MGKLYNFTSNFMNVKKDIAPEHLELLIKIGMKVKALRLKKKISYEQMAEEIGISRNTYSLLELGKISFQFSTLLLVLKYHGISVSKFFKGL
jgi:transcriptional regulator with XRE-family HTH domain